MATEQFVVVGLARPRTEWFAQVAKWASGASIPVEYLKCLGIHELMARLDSGRSVSAALIDASAPGVDRDLLDELRSRGCCTVVVGDSHRTRVWTELGASTTLPADFDRGTLMECLAEHAVPVSPATLVAASQLDDFDAASAPALADGWRGNLVAVTGGSGAGSSTVAMALAQGLAAMGSNTDSVILADLATNADLAMYHDARDVVPGLQEMVEAHRGTAPTPTAIAQMLFEIEARGYRLLLGLRRRRDWTTLRPRALGAAIESMCRSARWVICEVDDDIDGEEETGSLDIEERNVAARTALSRSDVTVVVGDASIKGVHHLARNLRDLSRYGVGAEQVLTVVNRAPRSPRARAELVEAISQLAGVAALSSPVFIADRRGMDDVHRHAVRMPDTVAVPLARAVDALVQRRDPLADPSPNVEPVRVRPRATGPSAQAS